MSAGHDTKAAARALLGLNSAAPRAVRSFTPPRKVDLSAEQEAILETTDHRLVITALAGAGKSRVLTEFVHRTPTRSWHYLAFNKSMAREASELMPKAACRTVHSLAFAAFGKPYAEKCNFVWDVPAIRSWCAIPSSAGDCLTVLVWAVVQRFIASADRTIGSSHIPMEHWKKCLSLSDAPPITLVVEWAMRLWEGMVNLGSPLPMDLDGIVKLMQLANYTPMTSKSSTFLVDEAQDLTPCIRAWIDGLPHPVIRAGDPHQSIYGWRMQGLSSPWVRAGEREMWLCGSWRFGPEVAELVNPVLRQIGCSHEMLGMAPSTLICEESGQEEVLLARTRAGLGRAAQARAKAGRLLNYSWAPWLLSGSGQGAMDDQLEDEHFEAAVNDLTGAESLAGQKVMTTHAAKGGSFLSVCLADDFAWPPSSGKDAAEEARILYVALTRAKERLALPAGLLDEIRKLKGGSAASRAVEDDGF